MKNFSRYFSVVLIVSSAWIHAQESGSASSKAVGTVQSVSGSQLVLKTDAGAQVNVTVQDGTRVLRSEPGQKSLKEATAIQLTEVQAGDRMAVMGKLGTDAGTIAATTMVVMKQGDIASKQQQERQDWARHSVGGLVKSVDAAGNIATISTTVMGQKKEVTVKLSPTTIVRRYAPDSVKFEDASKSTLEAVRPGDQLVARGNRNEDGSSLEAQEVVSGHFPYVSGTVQSVDKAKNQLTIMDLLSKKPVTVTVSAGSQLRKLPDAMAQRIAMVLKGGAMGTAAAGNSPSNGNATAGGAQNGTEKQRSAGAEGGGTGPGSGGAARGGDMTQIILSRAPVAQFTDLQKGDVVMLVATAGSTSSTPTVITLLAGVEPILTASPKGEASTILSPWSLGGGAAAGADAGMGAQ